MIRHLASTALAAAALVGATSAQAIDAAGPFPVGWDDFQFSHGLAASAGVSVRVYYPAIGAGRGQTADPTGGPFPLVAMIHGSGTFPFDYDLLCTHIASFGFVVGTIGTVGDFMLTIPSDVRGFLHWATEESALPASFLFEMVSSDPWSAVGHSSGAVALFSLVEMESNLTTAVAVEPSWFSQTGVDNFAGDLLIVAASEDAVTPPATHADLYLQNVDSTQRRLYFEILGGGHDGPLDMPLGPPVTLSHSEEHRLHRRAVSGFLRAEVKGEESLYVNVLGEGIGPEPVAVESRSDDTIQWIAESRIAIDSMVWGLARNAADTAVFILAPSTAAVPTLYGTLGLDPLTMLLFGGFPLSTEGLTELAIAIPGSLSGTTLHFQTLAIAGLDGAFSSTQSFTLP